MDTNERLAVLETKLQHMDVELVKTGKKVDEMHALLLQAKGFRWALMAFVSLTSLITGSILPWLFHK